MALADQIQNDMKVAMKAKDKDKLSALRDIKSKLLLESTSGSGEVTEEQEIKILQKLHKQRLESYKIYMEQGRDDLAAEEKLQADVIETYLPEMMSDEEVKKEVMDTIEAMGASSMADMGKVMGKLTKDLQGKADGSVISKYVKEALS